MQDSVSNSPSPDSVQAASAGPLVVPQGSLDGPGQGVSEVSTTPSRTNLDAKKPAKAAVSFWEEILSNPLWLMMAMFLVFYVGVLLPSQRSNKRQQRELAELISNLKKNDRVVTTFGVHGVVVSTQSEVGTVTIRLDENTNAKMTVNRDTIRVVKKD
jgi:preprotein translocase YajC subunit